MNVETADGEFIVHVSKYLIFNKYVLNICTGLKVIFMIPYVHCK